MTMKRILKRIFLCSAVILPLAGTARADGIEKGWNAFLSGDYATAIGEWQPLADKGDARAQVFMATIYNTGSGVPRDPAAGARWLAKAADQGNEQAQFGLGFAYFKGQGVPQDRVLAHMWFSLAAASGHARAADGRDRAAKRMSPAEIEKSRDLARRWTVRRGKR
jgi:TPR repeat protein